MDDKTWKENRDKRKAADEQYKERGEWVKDA
jgi:hypothetical protein